jgi:hypothetical protein
VGRFRQKLTGREPERLTLEARNFLIGRVKYLYEEHCAYFRLYRFEGKPYLLLKFVCD